MCLVYFDRPTPTVAHDSILPHHVLDLRSACCLPGHVRGERVHVARLDPHYLNGHHGALGARPATRGDVQPGHLRAVFGGCGGVL